MKISKISDTITIVIMLIILYINYNDIKEINGYKIPSSGEFWLLLFVFISTLIDKIPIKIKNKVIYIWTKIKPFGRKYFNFNMAYSIEVDNFDNITYKKIKEKLDIPDTKLKKIDNTHYTFNNFLKIEFIKDIEEEKYTINYTISKDNYSIGTLEKDLEYYGNNITKLNELYIINKSSILYEISVNNFYTPNYLLKKFSDDKKEFKINIGKNINFKKDGNKEVINIIGKDMQTAKENLKNYLNLSL